MADLQYKDVGLVGVARKRGLAYAQILVRFRLFTTVREKTRQNAQVVTTVVHRKEKVSELLTGRRGVEVQSNRHAEEERKLRPPPPEPGG